MGICGVLGGLHALLVGPADRRLAVAHQHDAGRHGLAVGGGRRGLGGLDGGHHGVPDGGALTQLQTGDRGLDLVVVEGRRHPHLHAAVERHQPDVELGGQQVDERLRRGLGGIDAGGAHVVGHHRQRGVDGHDDRGPLLGDLRVVRRPGERGDERDHAEQQGDGRQVAAPPGLVRRHDVEELEVGEAHGVGAPAALHDDVGDRQREGAGQQPEPVGGEEGHGELRVGSASGGRRRSGPASGGRERGAAAGQVGGPLAAQGHEADEVVEPVAVGAQRQVVGAGAADGGRDARSAAPAAAWA